jgi:hypothetical protein
MSVDFTLLSEVLRLAKLKGISFSLHYEEPSDKWYFSGGNFVGKSYSLAGAVSLFKAYMEGLR